MKRVIPLAFVALALAGCVSAPVADPADSYTISRQRPNEVLTGRPIRNLIAGANLNRGDLDRVTGLRISPTKVVDVYYRGA